jgi:diketogulonate reductase-like aldo/keto reductase
MADGRSGLLASPSAMLDLLRHVRVATSGDQAMAPTRRGFIEAGLKAGIAAALLPELSASVEAQQTLLRKPIPSTGEQIPVIGLGSAGTFDLSPTSREWEPAREVIRRFHQLGGRVIDTAPSYGRAEAFIGRTAQELGIQNDLFLATKVNVGQREEAAAVAEMEASSRAFGKRTIDLMQVWNLGDSIRNLTDRFLDAHIEAVREWKAGGRARYIGITTSRDPQYADFEAAMNRYPIDFVQLDYSIVDRIPEQRLLPLAREKRIAVITNRPFSGGQLFRRFPGAPPAWAAEFDCTSWAQFFLKFNVSHPAVTCAIPATNDPAHLVDNMGACVGRLPDEAMRRRMVSVVEGR